MNEEIFVQSRRILQSKWDVFGEKMQRRVDENIPFITYETNSVYCLLYKKSWVNEFEEPLFAETRIFFSVWVNDSTLREQKIFYNIHALKLRKLKGYSIESRKFANSFRAGFKNFEHKWQNVSVKYGPLTLMEGWAKFDMEIFEEEVLKLSNNFLEIDHLIDKTLSEFRK